VPAVYPSFDIDPITGGSDPFSDKKCRGSERRNFSSIVIYNANSMKVKPQTPYIPMDHPHWLY